MELLKTKLIQQSKVKEERERDLLQAKAQAGLEVERWKKAAEEKEKQL